MIIHIVKAGETMSSISRDYGVSLDWLLTNNMVPNPDNLLVGQSIVIMYPITIHIVRPGDTLTTIARSYGITSNEIFRNNITLYGNPDIYPGLALVIAYEGTSPYSFYVGGYAYPYIDKKLLNQSLPFMSHLMPFTYGFKSDGSLVMLNDEELLAAAFEYGSSPYMHLSTLNEEGNFDSELATSMLNNLEAQNVLLQNVLDVMIAKNYAGLDIDFEFIGGENAQEYIVFINKATRLMNSQGYPVITALAPKTSDSQPGILYEGHEYAGIGGVSNFVLLMTYEWGYTFPHTSYCQ